MKKILLTWSNGMLGTDFIKYFGNKFDIIALDRGNGDITNMEIIESLIKNANLDLILNFAAYTDVENAENTGRKDNFDVNTLWVYNLARLSAKYNIDFVTISTDYVFDGTQERWYNESDLPHPINNYGMAKYLWEILAKQENPNSIIIRTSWLYGWWKDFKNFVNTMLRLSETKMEVRVVNDQFWWPTYTVDLWKSIEEVLNNIENHRWKVLHLCNNTESNGISWFEFAEEIFKVAGIKTKATPCSSSEFATKVPRPRYSKLLWNDVKMRNREAWLAEYIKTVL